MLRLFARMKQLSLRHTKLRGDGMDETRGYELRDPRLPAIHGTSVGNGMEHRHSTSPLPENLAQQTAAERGT